MGHRIVNFVTQGQWVFCLQTHGHIDHIVKMKYLFLASCSVPMGISDKIAGAVAQWVRAFARQAEGWVFESKPRQT